MAFRNNLHSVLNQGWQSARQVWRLFAPGQEATFQPESIGSMGRDLDQLAYDLNRLGHTKPSRLAYSVAFILNSLAAQSIQFDRELAEKTSQIVAILAEMLLELESTSQITGPEPVDLVKSIEAGWGLTLQIEEPATVRPPRPHFRVQAADVAPEPLHLGLIAMSEELVWAAESLLNRVMQEGEFPHTAALGRIHHLGTTLRDRVVSLLQQDGTRTVAVATPAIPLKQVPVDSSVQIPILSEAPAEIDTLEEPTDADWGGSLSASEQNALRPALNQPTVLIIDESPFIRMVLSTAIENSGYATSTASSLAEAQASPVEWNLMVCGASELADVSAVQQLDERAKSNDAAVIILSDDLEGQRELIAGSHLIRRTDISSLLRLVSESLGPAVAIRQSA